MKKLLPLFLLTLGGISTPLVCCGGNSNPPSPIPTGQWENISDDKIFKMDSLVGKSGLRFHVNNVKKDTTYQADMDLSKLMTFNKCYSFGVIMLPRGKKYVLSIEHAHLKINDNIFLEIKEKRKSDLLDNELEYVDMAKATTQFSGITFRGCRDHTNLSLLFSPTDKVSIQFQITEDIETGVLVFSLT